VFEAAKVVHRAHAKDTDESSAADPADTIEVSTLLSLLVLFAVSAAAALLPLATTFYYCRLSKAEPQAVEPLEREPNPLT